MSASGPSAPLVLLLFFFKIKDVMKQLKWLFYTLRIFLIILKNIVSCMTKCRQP